MRFAIQRDEEFLKKPKSAERFLETAICNETGRKNCSLQQSLMRDWAKSTQTSQDHGACGGKELGTPNAEV